MTDKFNFTIGEAIIKNTAAYEPYFTMPITECEYGPAGSDEYDAHFRALISERVVGQRVGTDIDRVVNARAKNYVFRQYFGKAWEQAKAIICQEHIGLNQIGILNKMYNDNLKDNGLRVWNVMLTGNYGFTQRFNVPAKDAKAAAKFILMTLGEYELDHGYNNVEAYEVKLAA